MTSYRCWRVLGPRETEEQLVAEAHGRGCLGVHERASAPGSGCGVDQSQAELELWWPSSDAPRDPHRLLDRYRWRLLDWQELAEQDWMAPVRARMAPFDLGHGFRVDPREPDGAASPSGGRTVLRLPARRAFGVGSHETTQLIVELLEHRPPRHARVLDVGAGTGILGFVALALGASDVLGFDSDPVAGAIAAENCRLNRHLSSPHLFVGSVDALRPVSAFDCILVNVLPSAIEGQESSIATLLRESGSLLLSGILRSDERDVLSRWTDLELVPVDHRELGEWCALVLRRGAGS